MSISGLQAVLPKECEGLLIHVEIRDKPAILCYGQPVASMAANSLSYSDWATEGTGLSEGTGLPSDAAINSSSSSGATRMRNQVHHDATSNSSGSSTRRDEEQ